MRVLALVPPGTNSRAIYLDQLRGAQLAGHTVLIEDAAPYILEHQRRVEQSKSPHTEELRRMRRFFAAYVRGLVREHRCDLLMTLWVDPLMIMPWSARDGSAASAVAELGVPAVHYWLDAPFWAYGGRLLGSFDRQRFTDPIHIHAVNNPGTAAEMRTVLNVRSVLSAAYGVDQATFRPWPEIDPEFDLAINAGPGDPPPTPLMLGELSRDEPDVEAIRQEQAERAYPKLVEALSSADGAADRAAAGRLAESWLGEQLGAPDRPMLEKFRCALSHRQDEAAAWEGGLLRSAGSPVVWARAGALVRSVESWQRVFTATYLSQRFETVVFGSAGASWKSLGWPVRAACAGPVPYHEISAWYSRARAALNVMRYQDDVGMNIKGLEASASGRLVIERTREGLLDRFTPDEEVLAFTRPDEAAAKLRAVLADPDRLEAIASAGLERTRREHTWRIRADRLLRKAADRAGIEAAAA